MIHRLARTISDPSGRVGGASMTEGTWCPGTGDMAFLADVGLIAV
jgi:hypothetical protein